MNGKKKNLKRILPIVIISILLGSIVTTFAVPLLPMTVFGHVYIDLAPAGAGLNVYAKCGTTVVASDITETDGYYFLSIVEASGFDDGDPIAFYVGITYADETVPLEYGNMPLELDLYVAGVEPDTGTLIVLTTPVFDGEVSVNGVPWGAAPVSDTVDVGSYTVSFGAEAGYTKPTDKEAVVTKDTTTTITGIYVPLGVDTGTLTINTVPIGGPVFVDTVPWGMTPQSRDNIAVGPHTVSFGDMPGYTKPATVVVNVVLGPTVTVYEGTYVILDDDEPVVIPGEGFTIDLVWPLGNVDYDDTLTVYGSGVTAGSEVIVYWDYATGTYIHPLNNTEGNRDGTFDLEVTVPSDVVGDHYLWIKNVATGEIISSSPIQCYTRSRERLGMAAVV